MCVIVCPEGTAATSKMNMSLEEMLQICTGHILTLPGVGGIPQSYIKTNLKAKTIITSTFYRKDEMPVVVEGVSLSIAEWNGIVWETASQLLYGDRVIGPEILNSKLGNCMNYKMGGGGPVVQIFIDILSFVQELCYQGSLFCDLSQQAVNANMANGCSKHYLCYSQWFEQAKTKELTSTIAKKVKKGGSLKEYCNVARDYVPVQLGETNFFMSYPYKLKYPNGHQAFVGLKGALYQFKLNLQWHEHIVMVGVSLTLVLNEEGSTQTVELTGHVEPEVIVPELIFDICM